MTLGLSKRDDGDYCDDDAEYSQQSADDEVQTATAGTSRSEVNHVLNIHGSVQTSMPRRRAER
jgi:hypothetical protein